MVTILCIHLIYVCDFKRSLFEKPRSKFTNIHFDPETRQWTRTLSDSSDPVPRQAHAAAVSANQMYIHGGHTVSGQMLGDLLIFHVGAGNIRPCKSA